ncbi:MAG TPA: aminopeptidase [Pilimelia sp.]|nr:aminopeptidase [Pilimelia sp.]
MRRMMRWVLTGAMALAVAPAGAATAAPAPAPADEDIAARLAAVPGLSVSERTAPAPYRFFLLEYRQPVDHRRPAAGSFMQRITLLHKATDRPMVLHTTGYHVPTVPFRAEPTRLVDGNQISVEQRFFTPSRPEPADWSRLDIWQAATDHHRLVRALKPIYGGRWVSTGASKGGMTSVYHRRFYPSDVAGTVAYVAPNDVVDPVDSYSRFLDRVGTDAACRAALDALQREALRRRGELVTRYEAWARAHGRTFHRTIGTADRAYEMLVLDTPWAFWQYQLQADCAKVPPADASTDDLYAFLDAVASFDFYTDQGVDPYLPYYYQAGTQLGSPSLHEPHLRGLLRYPGLYAPRSYVPREIPMRYDHRAMADIDRWVRRHGSQLLFVYGQNDPWGAEPFRLGRGTRDSLWYEVAGGNHGANIAQLAAAQRDAATAALLRWADAAAPSALAAGAGEGTAFRPGLDDVNPLPRFRPRL